MSFVSGCALRLASPCNPWLGLGDVGRADFDSLLVRRTALKGMLELNSDPLVLVCEYPGL